MARVGAAASGWWHVSCASDSNLVRLRRGGEGIGDEGPNDMAMANSDRWFGYEGKGERSGRLVVLV